MVMKPGRPTDKGEDEGSEGEGPKAADLDVEPPSVWSKTKGLAARGLKLAI